MFLACVGSLEEKKILWVCLTLGVTNPYHCMPCVRDHKALGLDPSCVDLLVSSERSLGRVETTNLAKSSCVC